MIVATFLLSQTLTAGEVTISKAGQSENNPHVNKTMCSACHTPNLGGPDSLLFNGNILQLCQSCHDGQQATHQAHPVNLEPGTEIAARMSSDFPLQGGKITCSTCHNILWSCPEKQPANMANSDFLRGKSVPRPLSFCFNCHISANYQTFNLHDQFDEGKVKEETCLWCHTSVPVVNSNIADANSYGLRGNAVDTEPVFKKGENMGTRLCGSCHYVPADHPAGNSHMNSKPSKEMMTYIYAYEIQNKMNLPVKQLAKYVQATKKVQRLIPLDENGRITCYSCHNPHEKGLLPDGSLRSAGSEPKHAQNHRLRSYKGDISCKVCHQK